MPGEGARTFTIWKTDGGYHVLSLSLGVANPRAGIRADAEPFLQRGSLRVRGTKTTTIRRRNTLNKADANFGSRSPVLRHLTSGASAGNRK